ncbi:T-complex protein 1 subunit delta-like [Lepeophtheirus salmonis]|uniref:T-complex protein 1 subunit delta-like n=1 Tax=Lepeophtheirus salmonis TaxID=72036 RepID=UPI003AF3C14E
MAVKDVDFISKTLGYHPITSADRFNSKSFVLAYIILEVESGMYKTVSIIIRGSNKLMLEEDEISFYDSVCLIHCLVKKCFIIPCGCVTKTELFLKLNTR